MKVAVFFLLATAALHTFGLLSGFVATNETEKTMLGLMASYKMEMGGGFTPSMNDLMKSFSISLSLLLVFGAFTNLVLLRTKSPGHLVKSMLGLQVLVFGACFVTMLMLTFIVPVVCTGLVFVSLLTAYFLSLNKTP